MRTPRKILAAFVVLSTINLLQTHASFGISKHSILSSIFERINKETDTLRVVVIHNVHHREKVLQMDIKKSHLELQFTKQMYVDTIENLSDCYCNCFFQKMNQKIDMLQEEDIEFINTTFKDVYFKQTEKEIDGLQEEDIEFINTVVENVYFKQTEKEIDGLQEEDIEFINTVVENVYFKQIEKEIDGLQEEDIEFINNVVIV